MSDELDDLIQGFVEESHEAFEAIENDLLTIEENPEDISIVNGIFRVLHTIKGTAGFMGLDEINQLAHKLETLFDMIRKETLPISPDLMDTLLPAIDLLKLMVFELVVPERSEYDLINTMEILETIAGGDPATAVKSRTIKVDFEAPPVAAEVEEPEVIEDDGPMVMELVGEFVQEAEEHLQTVEENLLKLEKQPDDDEAINEVFRAIHSIKGTASYVNVGKINRLSHKMETVFDRVRKGSATYSPELADLILKGLDLLRTLIFMIKMGESTDVIQVTDLITQLDQRLGSTPGTDASLQEPKKSVKGTGDDKSKSVSGDAVSPLDAFKNICTQHLLPVQVAGAELEKGAIDDENLMVLSRITRTLSGAAEKIGALELKVMVDELSELVLSVLSAEKKASEVSGRAGQLKTQIEAQLNHFVSLSEEEFHTHVEALPKSSEAAQEVVPAVVPAVVPKTTPAPAQAQSANDSEIKTMRVDSYRLDTFMNLIGELIIARNSFNHTLGEVAGANLPGHVMSNLRNVEAAFNRISEDLQGTLMEMRLVPVKTVFQKIPRIVRDISRKTGKNIHGSVELLLE